jgi:hypothetical protein
VSKRNQQNQQQTKYGGTEKPSPTIPVIVAIIGALGLIIVALINRTTPFIPIQATQTAEAKLQNLSFFQTPTVISPGNKVFEIKFSTHGEGNCNDYDKNKLGYDINQKLYYIIPEANGYASVCHVDDKLQPQGILQTTAFPDSDSSLFGYAVFWGWKGNNIATTDACGFGVRKKDSKTEAIFIQIIAGHWKHISTDLDMLLDASPHAIRMVLYPSGDAYGYLDGKLVASLIGDKRFIDCGSGPVGLIAYGPGQLKINFTSLKLFALP